MRWGTVSGVLHELLVCMCAFGLFFNPRGDMQYTEHSEDTSLVGDYKKVRCCIMCVFARLVCTAGLCVFEQTPKSNSVWEWRYEKRGQRGHSRSKNTSNA